MALFDLPFDSIDEKALLGLIENEVRESIVLDYKRDLPGRSDEDKKEFLRDVTAFANAEGGDIIFGMAEDDGVANDLVGLEGKGLDDEMLRLNNLLRDGVDPRIHGLNMKPIALANGRQVLHIRIPKSLEAPHLVQLGNHKQFWIRNPSGKHSMSSTEVKATVMRTQDWKQRAEAWRTDRIKLVRQQDGPVRMEEGPLIFVHFVPLENAGTPIQLVEEHVQGALRIITAPGAGRWDSRMTFDGLLVARELPGSMDENSWYWLWHHNGCAETVRFLTPQRDNRSPQGRVSGLRMEREIYQALEGFLQAQTLTPTPGPFLMLITLTGVNRTLLSIGDMDMYLDSMPMFDRDSYPVPGLFAEHTPSNLWQFLSPSINRLWQAAGQKKSPYLNGDGTRIPTN